MPDEFRFLVFSPAEAAEALAAYARAGGRKLPAGRPVAARPDAGDAPGGRLLIEAAKDAPAEVAFTANDVLDALVRYCIGRGIPLPLASEKTLERLHGRFALRIGHVDSIEHQMRSHAPPQRR